MSDNHYPTAEEMTRYIELAHVERSMAFWALFVSFRNLRSTLRGRMAKRMVVSAPSAASRAAGCPA